VSDESSPAPSVAAERRRERRVIAVVGAVQFVNILDFMMVMPLGPDFAKALGIPTSTLGLIGGSYTAAGAVAGLIGMFFLDRFGRRAALVTAMAGLSLATLSGALATDLHTLMAARVLAGIFGGPATSLAVAIVTDVVPGERRGRAMGAVMGAFSAASVLGVPLGLELARLSTWHTPFVAVAGFGAVVTVGARLLLPRLDGHLREGQRAPPISRARLGRLLTRPEVVFAYVIVASTNFSSFLFIPNISALLQQNFGFPREDLGALYLVGGAISFFTMRGAGALVDRFGSARLMAVGVVAFSLIVGSIGIYETAILPITVVFALFMVFQSTRNVSQQTMTSKVPNAEERGGFQSISSAVQHGASATGAVVSSAMLHESAGRLEGMPVLAVVAITVAVVGVPIAFLLEGRLRR
jgi:predicted MFS family arabinose efflux permease